MLALLNARRDAQGAWQDDGEGELLCALLSQRAGEHPPGEEGTSGALGALRSARPPALSPPQWATLLALAFLRKHLGGQAEAWQAMEAKALEWLRQGWPRETEGLRSPAATLMAALKLV